MFKQQFKNTRKHKQGFSLIEIMVSMAILMLLFLGVYDLVLFTLRINADNQSYVIAINLANQKMEHIRNLPYDDVGTLTGSPAGVIPEYETVDNFEVHTTVMFYDDPYDGTIASGTDSIFVDYKIATIDVSWLGRFAQKKVSIFSKIIPNTEETLSGYGLLKLLIVDSNGSTVSGADIHIENTSPIISADYTSDSNGQLNLPLLPDIEGYEVTVTKTNYSIDQTYTRDATNPNPTKAHLSIFDGVKTEESFAIDKLGAFTIRTVSNNLPANFQVNSEIASSSDEAPRLALDSADNMYFAWQSQNATNTEILLQKFNSSKVKQWASDLNISTTKHQINPDIQVDSTGDIYLTWQDNSASLKATAYNHQLAPRFAYFKNNYSLSLNTYKQTNTELAVLPPTYKWGQLFNNLNTKIINIFQNIYSTMQNKPLLALDTATVIQTAIGSPVNYSHHMNATFSSTPTAGNIIIAIAVNRSYSANFSAPTNANGTFSVAAYSNIGWVLDTGIWYKVAGASEPTMSTINCSANIRGGVLMLIEVSGIDTSNPVDLTSIHDQTSNNSHQAYTGATALSQNKAFAIAGIAFADNNFSTPNSSNWSSDSGDIWIHRLWRDWSTGRDGSLAVATLDIANAHTQGATLLLSGGGGEERNSALAVFNLAVANDATLSAFSTQNAQVIVPNNNFYLGGGFMIQENGAGRSINSITVTENGSLDAQTHLSNFKLFYDLDTSAPYDCASEAYNSGTDLQFGTSSTFSASDGIATLTQTGGVNIDTTHTLCLYPVMDIDSDSEKDLTIDITINNPTTDIITSTGTIIPATPIAISGSTIIQKPADIRQESFRFRNDDNDEVLATWRNNEKTSISMPLSENLRLRFLLHNSGSLDTGNIQYQLEYGQSSNCSSVASWIPLPTDTSQHWQIYNSTNLTDNTTASNVTPGIFDTGTTFINGYVKDTNNLTPNINLADDEFTEIEFSIKPTINAQDNDYCFRLTNNGSTTSFTYDIYPQISIVGDDNIYIIGLDNTGAEKWPVSKVNSDSSNYEQTNPRLSITENFGLATTCIVWQDGRNGQSDIYMQSYSASGTKLWTSDKRITSSSTEEIKPAIAIDSQDNIFVAWTDEATNKYLYLAKYDLAGNALWATPQKIFASSSADYDIDIKIGPGDYPYLAWTSESGTSKTIYLGKYDATSTNFVWLKIGHDHSSSADKYAPSIYPGNQYIYLAWTDQRENNDDIYTQKFDFNGASQWSNDLKINVNTGNAPQKYPTLLVNSSNEPLAVWQDLRSVTYDIFATIFNDPGATVGVPNVPLIITGTKKIGENPIILKTEEYYTTDTNGYLYLTPEWDVPGYSINLNSASTSLSIIMRNPIQPMKFLANDIKTMLIYVE